MKSKQKELSDFIFNILNIIIEQNIGPTYAARLLYVYTSLIRLGNKIIKPSTKLCNKYRFNINLIKDDCIRCRKYYKYYKYYKSFRNYYLLYIAIQSMKLIHKMFPDSKLLRQFIIDHKIKKVFKKTNRKFRNFLKKKKLLRKIKLQLRSFYLYLDKDGRKKANKQIKLKNNYYIDPEYPINVEKLNNPESWCLLKGQKQLGPYWGNVKDLLHKKDTRKIELYLDKKYQQIDVVKENKKVLQHSLQLNDEQKISAEFWQGIPGSVSPAGFWTMFLYRYFKANHKPNSVQANFYYKLTCAEFQASITCWKVKYQHLQLRPIQCIRLNYPNTKFDYYFGNNVKGNMWLPFQEPRMYSPPFPDYISGHSTFSAAGATILNKLIGKKIDDNIKISTQELKMLAPIFKNQPHEIFNLNQIFINSNTSLIQKNIPSKKISFKMDSWDQMALHAGMSRIHGGIHIHPSNDEGFVAGKKIGNLILKKLI